MRGYVRFFLIGLLLIGLFGAPASANVSTPPASVTGLHEDTIGETWINWTWINPLDVDFSHTIVSIDSVFVANVSNSTNYYNASGFSSGTSHDISTRTVDIYGNINSTSVSDSATTSDNTPPLSITDLDEASVGPTSIRWEWTNPSDSDFNHTMIFLNGSFVTNTSSTFYENTSLSSGTTYEISTHTVDESGNINTTWVSDTATTSTLDATPPASITDLDDEPGDHWIKWTWTNPSDTDFSHVMIYINGEFQENVSDPTNEYNATGLSSQTTYNISTHTVDTTGNINATWVNGNATTLADTTAPATVTGLTASAIGVDWIKWTWTNPSDVDFNHTVVLIDNVFVANVSNTTNYYNATGLSSNTNHTIKTQTVDITGNIGTVVSDTATTVSQTYYTGNRIWEEGMSLTYTWDGESYSGFYYDLDSGLTSETLTIELNSGSRTVGDGKLEYATRPIITDFEHEDWGSYQVIGFMAEKYFAGYTEVDTEFVDDDISMMSKGQLSKILMDDDDRVSAYSGSSLLLEDGYALSIVEVDREGDKVFVLLTKDGSEVDDAIVSSDDDYIYEKDMGSVDDVPIIVVHFRDIFSGIETNAVFVEGIFQISDEYEEVESGDNYGEMEIDSVSSTEITMKNDGLFSLSRGDIIDIMGELKFEVADSGTLRFAPFVDISKPGTYELRGTVAGDDDMEWTTLNFEGFYYNMDEGIGTESLAVTYTDRTIDDGDLVYTTTADDVSFEYDGASGWDKYNVVGFIGEKYFAGYPAGTFGNSGAVSIMSDGQLSKVLIDDDDKVSLYAGSALVLEEGYLLQIVELDRDGSKVFVSLKKDGSEVDEEIVSTDDTYVYEKDLGSSEDVPVIAVHFEEIFSGIETSAVFVEGIFQISDNYLEIESGDTYGEMEVDEISSTKITMVNEDSISLSAGDTVDVMDYGGNEIQFKVADSGTVRYYPFVEVTVKPTESLDIDMPASVKEDETLTITVTSRGAAVRDVTVKFDGDIIGTTSRDGIVTYKPTEAGTFTVAVEKDGYISASGKIEVISPQDETKKMSIVVSPDEVYEGTKVTISTVRSIGGEAIEDAEILYDNNPIGTTSADGTLSYTAKEAGMHKITATRDGFIDAALNLEVLALEADFEFSNLVVSPLEVKAGKDVTITVDVSNDGKAEGEYNVELYINGNVTDSQQIALGVGESTTVEFTHSEDVPGTYEVTIQGLSGTFDVLEKGSSALLYVVGILGVFAVIAAGYMFTAGGWTVEMVTEKVAEFIESIRR